MMEQSDPAKKNQPARPVRDFGVAFVGWFAIQGLFWGLIIWTLSQMGSGAIAVVCFLLLPFPANVLILLRLYRKRQWLAFGGFSAIVVNSIWLILTKPVADDSFWLFLEIFGGIPFFLRDWWSSF
jgi:hypothetical protein